MNLVKSAPGRRIARYVKQDSETTTHLVASGVVSRQRLRLRRLTFVKRVPKLRFEPVSFRFLAFFPEHFEVFDFGSNTSR